MLRILISNDDGIHSLGIYQLANSLSSIGKVIVVAPESERSASGHSITMHKPLRSKSVDFFGKDIEAWCINGTPSDCIKFALQSLLKEKPNLIVSGINHGSNLGTDVLYSGTVSAAVEGAINGIPSIALSLCCHDNCDFKPYAKISSILCKQLYDNGIEKGIVININFPYIPKEELKGIRITSLGVRRYRNCFVERKDPRGKSYYWLAGELEDEENSEDTDVNSINNKYISITPIKIDLTSHEMINKMREWELKI